MLSPGDQGWHSGESAFNCRGAICELSLLLVLALLREFPSGLCGFPPFTKPTFPISNSITIEDPIENQLRLIVSYCNFFFKFTSVSNRNREKQS